MQKIQNVRIKIKFKCFKFYKQIWKAVDDMVIIESNVYNKTHDTKFEIQLPMMNIKNNIENDVKYAKYTR